MNELYHIGTKFHSGRYPWGSGEDPHQSSGSFLSYVRELRKEGVSDVNIAAGLGYKTPEFRAKYTLAVNEARAADASKALRLKDKGYSNTQIGVIMGKNESSIRALLNPAVLERTKISMSTANMLKDSVEKNKYIDIGRGVESQLGVSRPKLNSSIELLKQEGYKVHYLTVQQAGTGKNTSMMVLSKEPDWKIVNENKHNIKMPLDIVTKDGGRTWFGLDPIKSVDSSRIAIKYKEDGGSDKDGVIELRRNTKDLDLGNSRYAQVRIGVDGTHFLKGMAVYSDEMPDGVDIIYNTNKKKGTDKYDVFKPMKRDETTGKIDPDNPFGALIKTGGQKGALNIVNEEGDWSDWSKTLSSQILSKQNKTLVKQQLDLAYKSKLEEYEEIMSLTNSAVKKKLLSSFADDCDSSSVHLKAAALPRQGWHAILPFPNMKETEVYAPNYRDGERVVLIRHPHGGLFEIPELVVNNRQKDVKSIIGRSKDAIGIHPKVAAILSGADFDGDTVLVIPNDSQRIKTKKPLKDLQDFDPKISYPGYEGMKVISASAKQKKMGDISNLITDMTIGGATDDELIRAVKHSMVVIDSEKHKLNYKQSYIDNGIPALKKKYQGKENAGAATLISRASSDKRVPFRKEGAKLINPETGKPRRVYIDPKTGKKLYEYTDETYTVATVRDPSTGKKIKVFLNSNTEKDYDVLSTKTFKKTIKSTKMAEVDDARELSSGTLIEEYYADYANKLKALGNKSRLEYLNSNSIKYEPSANKAYHTEVNSLKAQLNIALRNAPLERQAQLLANKIVKAKQESNPNLDDASLKKIKGQAITEARTRIGASKTRIDISDKEWAAIQAGAVSNNIVMQILDNTDLDKVKNLALPRQSSSLSGAKLAKAKSMLASGYTQAEIADHLGISTTVVNKALG